MRKIALIFLLITSITIIGCSSDSGSSSSGPGPQVDSKRIKSIVTNYSTVYAITEDDRLYAWGYNRYGEVGNGSSGDHVKQKTPYEVKEVGTVKSIVTTDYYYGGDSTVYAITTDDRLYAWGSNFEGQVGNGKSGNVTTPYEVREVGKVKSVVTTGYHHGGSTVYAITTDDRLYAWGRNDNGQVGNGESGNGYYVNQTTPYEVKKVGTVKSVVTNGDTVYAITEDDRLYAWGKNHHTTPFEVIIFK